MSKEPESVWLWIFIMVNFLVVQIFPILLDTICKSHNIASFLGLLVKVFFNSPERRFFQWTRVCVLITFIVSPVSDFCFSHLQLIFLHFNSSLTRSSCRTSLRSLPVVLYLLYLKRRFWIVVLPWEQMVPLSNDNGG